MSLVAGQRVPIRGSCKQRRHSICPLASAANAFERRSEMKVSRRIMLKNVAIVATLAAARSVLAADGKATKEAMHYQDRPKDGQQCATCVQFIPGAKPGANGKCQIVEGPISPEGWCIEYIKKT